MSSIAQELDARLRELDPERAQQLEQVVRKLLALVPPARPETDELGYPRGYFEATSGSFAHEPLERPEPLPLEVRDEW